MEGSKNNKRIVGQWGEQQAASFLLRRGFTILDKNFFARVGEIDLIAQKDGTLFCVEVKTRCGLGLGSFESVNYFKRKSLEMTARLWLAKNRVKCESIELAVLVVLVNKIAKTARFYWFSGWGE